MMMIILACLAPTVLILVTAVIVMREEIKLNRSRLDVI